MRFAQRLRRFPKNPQSILRATWRNPVEALESRTLLNAALTSTIAPVSVGPGATTASVNLGSHFNDPLVPGTAVEIQTPEGNIPLALLDSKTPKTVANFEHYISTGEYNNVIVHRSIPGFVIQGGGYTTDGNHINQFAPVQGEPGVSNTTGTIAMALSAGPNSGTSEWFINLANNTALDTGDGGPFTVFGNVIYGGMTTVNSIAGLPTVNDSQVPPQAGTWSNLPVVNYSGSSTPSSVPPANMVVTNTVNVPALTYAATSDNPALVTAAVSGNNLALTYGTGTGTAHVTVTATDLGGNVATTTFAVNVGSNQVTVGKGAAARLVRFTDPDGTASQVTVGGAGTATLQFNGTVTVTTAKNKIATVTGTPTSVVLSTTGTNKTSTVTITGRGGNGVVNLAGINTDAPLRAITGRNTALTGNLQAAGGLGTLTLNSANNGILGIGPGTAINLNIGSGGNESVNSGATINNLRAGSWEAGAQVHAPTITRANIRDFFAADLSTSAIGNFHAGSLTGGTWTVSGRVATLSIRTASGWTGHFETLGRLAVSGAFDSSTASATGSIDAVNALSMSGSNVFAGIAPTTTTLPSTPSAFVAPSSITALHVARGFSNTNIAAMNLGRISAGVIQVANNGTPFGFAGHSIKTLSATAAGRHLRLANVTSAGQLTTALTKEGFTQANAGNFEIRII